MYAGFDCCRVMPSWATKEELKVDKGDNEDTGIANEGQLCLQFGARKGKTAMIFPSNVPKVSNFTLDIIKRFFAAKEGKKVIEIPQDLMMSRFINDYGESFSTAFESYVFDPINSGLRPRRTNKDL